MRNRVRQSPIAREIDSEKEKEKGKFETTAESWDNNDFGNACVYSRAVACLLYLGGTW